MEYIIWIANHNSPEMSLLGILCCHSQTFCLLFYPINRASHNSPPNRIIVCSVKSGVARQSTQASKQGERSDMRLICFPNFKLFGFNPNPSPIVSASFTSAPSAASSESLEYDDDDCFLLFFLSALSFFSVLLLRLFP